MLLSTRKNANRKRSRYVDRLENGIVELNKTRRYKTSRIVMLTLREVRRRMMKNSPNYRSNRAKTRAEGFSVYDGRGRNPSSSLQRYKDQAGCSKTFYRQ